MRHTYDRHHKPRSLNWAPSAYQRDAIDVFLGDHVLTCDRDDLHELGEIARAASEELDERVGARVLAQGGVSE